MTESLPRNSHAKFVAALVSSTKWRSATGRSLGSVSSGSSVRMMRRAL